jgi:type IV secretory pathway TraG/TraD family ATPase VirD4
VASPLAPADAWEPVNQGTAPAGAVGWWFTLLVLAGSVVAVPIVLVRRADRQVELQPGGQLPPATARDVHRAHLERRKPTQLVVGAAGHEEVALHAGDSLLVIGPTGAGKTSAVTIPAVLRWPGPVVATSTAGDFLDRTIGWRSRQGEVHVFDPAATTPYAPSGWSPLATSATWGGATRTAWDLAMSARPVITGRSLVDPWLGSAARFLAPYLYAAARSSRTMGDVARWIDSEELDEVLPLLRPAEREASDLLMAKFRRDDATRETLFSVMQRIVAAYLDPAIAASPERNDIHADELLDGEPHTLYIAAPHHDQARLQPLFATLVRQVLAAVAERVALTGEPLDPPLLLILDDAPNIAAVDDLPTLARTAAADGVQLVSVFRDLTQIEVRYDDAAPAVVSNHRAKLLLPGAEGVPETPSAGGSRAVVPELAHRVPTDAAVLLHGDARPLRLGLLPWYKDRELRRRAEVSQDALLPGNGAAATQASPARQLDGRRAPSVAPSAPPPPPPAAPSPGPVDTRPPAPLPSNVSPITAARGRSRRRGRTAPPR